MRRRFVTLADGKAFPPGVARCVERVCRLGKASGCRGRAVEADRTAGFGKLGEPRADLVGHRAIRKR